MWAARVNATIPWPCLCLCNSHRLNTCVSRMDFSGFAWNYLSKFWKKCAPAGAIVEASVASPTGLPVILISTESFATPIDWTVFPKENQTIGSRFVFLRVKLWHPPSGTCSITSYFIMLSHMHGFTWVIVVGIVLYNAKCISVSGPTTLIFQNSRLFSLFTRLRPGMS